MTQLQITLRRVRFPHTARARGGGVFHLHAYVDHEAFGDRAATFAAAERVITPHPASSWRKLVDVSGDRRELGVRVHLVDAQGGSHGQLEFVWRAPFTQNSVSVAARYFGVELEMALAGGGEFARRGPSTVYASRFPDGASQHNAVVAGRLRLHLEADPVVPTPTRTDLRRPGFTRQVAPEHNLDLSPQRFDGATILNPSVIPLGAPARIAYSTLWASGPFDERELSWRAVALDGGAVDFIGEPRGKRVEVRGRERGEVRLEVSYRGRLLSALRALVRQPVTLPYRLNCLRATSGDVQLITNRAWWAQAVTRASVLLSQLGITLRPDDDAQVSDGARPIAGLPGCFEVPCDARDISHLPQSDWPRIARFNARPWVINLVLSVHGTVVDDTSQGGPQGGIVLYSTSRHGASIREHEFPSPSWNRPHGLPPVSGVREVQMRTLESNGPADTLALCLFERGNVGAITPENLSFASPTQVVGPVASLLSHEIGHGLNLFHRGASFTEHDGYEFPLDQNLMNYGGQRYDLDVAQARVVWGSQFVTHYEAER